MDCRLAILLILFNDVISFLSIPAHSKKAKCTLHIIHEKKEAGMEMTKRCGFLCKPLSLVILTTIGDESIAKAVERAVGGAEK